MKYMKIIKIYENWKEDEKIIYQIGDIVVCHVKKYKDDDFQGYINQEGEFENEDDDLPIYGKKYKVKVIYFDYKYTSLKKKYYYLSKVHVEDIENGEILRDLHASLFIHEKDWVKPNDPMIGDYVLCETNIGSEYANEFIRNNIGRNVGGISTLADDEYIIQYRNIPESGPIKYSFWNSTNPYIKNLGNITLKRKNIIYYSENKKDLEPFITANKFNL